MKKSMIMFGNVNKNYQLGDMDNPVLKNSNLIIEKAE